MTKARHRERIMESLREAFAPRVAVILGVTRDGGLGVLMNASFRHGSEPLVDFHNRVEPARRLCDRLIELADSDDVCRRLCASIAFGDPRDESGEGPF